MTLLNSLSDRHDWTRSQTLRAALDALAEKLKSIKEAELRHEDRQERGERTGDVGESEEHDG